MSNCRFRRDKNAEFRGFAEPQNPLPMYGCKPRRQGFWGTRDFFSSIKESGARRTVSLTVIFFGALEVDPRFHLQRQIGAIALATACLPLPQPEREWVSGRKSAAAAFPQNRLEFRASRFFFAVASEKVRIFDTPSGRSLGRRCSVRAPLLKGLPSPVISRF